MYAFPYSVCKHKYADYPLPFSYAVGVVVCMIIVQISIFTKLVETNSEVLNFLVLILAVLL